MKLSVQEAEKQNGEERKGDFHNRKYPVPGPPPHFTLCRLNNIWNAFDVQYGDKGGENRSLGRSFSLLMWFQFSLIAGNLVFNIN